MQSKLQLYKNKNRQILSNLPILNQIIVLKNYLLINLKIPIELSSLIDLNI